MGGLGQALWGLCGLALLLRWWRLGAINELVFDEVYYVQFAVDYLRGQPVFDAHPPLGKYLIAIAIALGQPWADWLGWAQNDGVGVLVSPISYRWLNGLVGATLPGLVGLLAYQLMPAGSQKLDQQRRGFALAAAGLMILEGFTLVESRLALINIYWVMLGVLGQLGLMRSGPWRLVGGMALGAAVSVKWNGAGFLLGLWLVWGLGRWLPTLRQIPVARLKTWEFLVYALLVPGLTYLLLWIPHLLANPGGLIAIHQQLWQVHERIAQQSEAHPYCSAWYSWPLMLRPLAYFYEQMTTPVGTTVITDIHGMGNPLSWWLGTAAIVALVGKGVSSLRSRVSKNVSALDPVAIYLLVNFAANWLPWVAIQRCTFLYLYLGSLVFAQMALAWLLSRWYVTGQRFPVYLLFALIAVAFLFWLPIFIGLPLDSDGFWQRMWLRSWV
ncbi:dolichyl-phosphate-mannose--protein O-mannosyl transferase [filamentous cyanobacterium CCP5]|nr:dolichyl-phosphate-mannose--protein O-mannosyl transferase [filamentous cyanobacterium CCP5]